MGDIVTEDDIRTFVTPSISTDDAASAEIVAKIAAMEAFVKQVYFNGESLPVTTKYPIIMLTISKLLESPTLAKKYAMLESEKLGDYQYKIATQLYKAGSASKTWYDLAMMMLETLTTSDRYYIQKVND